MFPPFLCLFPLLGLLLCFPLGKLPLSFLALEKRLYLREREYQPLYQALIHVDTAYLDQYMSAKKAETYRLFHNRQ